MKRALRTWLRLGRVSNLPTVWTNVLAGTALAGPAPACAPIVAVSLSLSCLYVAGMCLNDAFDRSWDARHRPERPIPAGDVRARSVFAAGFGLLLAGLLLLPWAAPGTLAPAGGLALGALIVLYDTTHKRNPIAPLLMGLCRAAVYLTAGLATIDRPGASLLAGTAAIFLYVSLLSALAAREAGRPRLLRHVGRAIAGICLLDAVALGLSGHPSLAGLAVVGYPLTRLLQRRIPGT